MPKTIRVDVKKSIGKLLEILREKGVLSQQEVSDIINEGLR